MLCPIAARLYAAAWLWRLFAVGMLVGPCTCMLAGPVILDHLRFTMVHFILRFTVCVRSRDKFDADEFGLGGEGKSLAAGVTPFRCPPCEMAIGQGRCQLSPPLFPQPWLALAGSLHPFEAKHRAWLYILREFSLSHPAHACAGVLQRSRAGTRGARASSRNCLRLPYFLCCVFKQAFKRVGATATPIHV